MKNTHQKKEKNKKILLTKEQIINYFGDDKQVKKILKISADKKILPRIQEDAENLTKTIETIKTNNFCCQYRNELTCLITLRKCQYRSFKQCMTYRYKGRHYFLFVIFSQNQSLALYFLKNEPVCSAMIKALDKIIGDGFCPKEISLAFYILFYNFLDLTIIKYNRESKKEKIIKRKKITSTNIKLKEAKLLNKQGKYNDSLKILKKIKKEDCKNYNFVNQRIVELRIELGKHPSYESLKSAILNRHKKIFFKYAKNRANELKKEKDFKGAIKYYLLIPRKYFTLRTLRNYAICLEKRHNYSYACKLYHQINLPISYFDRARCYYKLKKYPECWEEIVILFSLKNSSIATKENVLKLAKELYKNKLLNKYQIENLVKLSKQILSIKPESKVAISIIKKFNQEKIEWVDYRKKDARKFLNKKNYEKACSILLEIPENLIDEWSIEQIALCYEKLDNYPNALKWHSKLPINKQTITKRILLTLHLDFEKAYDLLKYLKEYNIWIDDIKDPNVKGYIFEIEGKYDDAVDRYESENLLFHLVKIFQKNQDYIRITKCYLKLYKVTKKKENLGKAEECLQKFEEKLTVKEKSINREFLETKFKINLKRKELVICDTNVFVHKVFYNSPEYQKYDSRSKRHFDILVKNFDCLKKSHMIVATNTVKEQLKIVCIGLFNELHINNEKEKSRLIERLERYIKKYYQDVIFDDEKLKMISTFYLRFSDRIKSISDKKIQRKSFRAAKQILHKRSQGYLPEETDIKLLAECISFNEMSIEGVNQISLFSDDADFRDFKKEIKERFSIKVY
jgi:hypothetical protein